MRISKQLLEHLKFLKENILLINNKQTGNHSREKENTYTKKEPTGNSIIEKNTSEINALDGLTADWRTVCELEDRSRDDESEEHRGERS